MQIMELVLWATRDIRLGFAHGPYLGSIAGEGRIRSNVYLESF